MAEGGSLTCKLCQGMIYYNQQFQQSRIVEHKDITWGLNFPENVTRYGLFLTLFFLLICLFR